MRNSEASWKLGGKEEGLRRKISCFRTPQQTSFKDTSSSFSFLLPCSSPQIGSIWSEGWVGLGLLSQNRVREIVERGCGFLPCAIEYEIVYIPLSLSSWIGWLSQAPNEKVWGCCWENEIQGYLPALQGKFPPLLFVPSHHPPPTNIFYFLIIKKYNKWIMLLLIMLLIEKKSL